jgi:tetratricopeptide (TPR) repeat protein
VAMAVLFVLSLGTAAYAYRLKQFAQESYESAVKATDEAVKARESAEKEKEKAVLLFRQLQENNKQLDEEKEVSAARAEQAEEEKKKAVAAQDKAEAAEDAALGAKKVAEEASAEALASKKTAVENLEKARAANDRGDLTIQGFEMSVRDFPNRAMDSFDKLAGQIDNTLKRASGSMSESEVRELKLSLGWALSHLGAEQLKTGDLSGAKASYERSRDIFEAEYPRESQVNKYPTPFLFDMYHGLGRAYHNIALEGGDEAKKYYEQAKGVFLSSLEVQMTQFEGAELAAKATKDTNESAETAFFVNEGAKQVTASRLALAHLYRDMGQPDDAEKVLVELVNFQTARGDADKLIAARNELAEFNRDQNLFLAAERDYKKLIEEQEKHVGDIEADYAQRGVGLAASYNELAEVYRAQGAEKRQKSEDAYAAAIAIQRLATRLRRLQAAGDSNDVDIREDSTDDPADNAGDAYVKLGKFERARSLYEYALGVREAGSGPIRRDLWKSYDKLTRLYREKGFADDAKAEEYNLKLISELSNVEPNSPRHAEALSLCADIYAKQERPSEARAYYENALGIYAERNDWMNQNVVLYRIGELYKLKKAVRPEWKAASLRRLELLTTQLNKIVGTKETLPRGSITLVTEYLDAVETVAVIQTLDKNDVEAAATYQKAFDTYDFIKGRIYNPRALSIYAKFLNRYKVLLNKLGRQEEAAKVEASISGLQAKANDINQEQQGSQPTPQGQTQPAGAQ